MKSLILRLLPIVDLLLLPLVYPAAWLLKQVRRAGVHRLPACRGALLNVGVFPVRDHYYEPQFDLRHPNPPFTTDRSLPGIDWNVDGQLTVLDRFTFAAELADWQPSGSEPLTYYLQNGFFESGDAEYWYQLIRAFKPKRIIEVGSGHSTLVAARAIRRNRADDPAYACEHVCIEPFETPWLEQLGVSVLRRKVEDVDLSFFSRLGENDVLFIDSSHIIRPQGDVLFEYLQLLPTLAPGVIVHVHDIFSPKNYLPHWLSDEVKFWNEQYLLEAFLCHNRDWRIVGALNYLQNHHYERFKAVAPFITPDRVPGSFYIQRRA
jgi:hypothetical protein